MQSGARQVTLYQSRTQLENLIKKTATKDVSGSAQVPAHEQVYQKIRVQILFGELAPGQAVTIQGLTDSLDVGMTPVREAIRRLISDGALIFQGNRRVSVPVLSVSDTEQLIFIRKTIEYELARRAALQISHSGVTLLEHIDTALDRAISSGDVAGYLAQNYSFHRAIYDQADAPVMAEIADRLWLRFGPSLRVVCGRFGTQSLPDRHKELLDAFRRNDADAAAKAMVQDVEQGMELILEVLANPA